MGHKESAERVKTLMKPFPGERREKLLRAHNCTLLKEPRVPEAFYLLFPSLSKKISERKTNQVSSEWNEESKQTHDKGTHIEIDSSPISDLIPARVNRWKIKEYQHIAKKIKALSNPKKESRQFKIEDLNETSQLLKGKRTSQDELWQEMMKTKEERQFQIGRLTKYFS